MTINAFKGTVKSDTVQTSFTTPQHTDDTIDLGQVSVQDNSAEVKYCDDGNDEPSGQYEIVWTAGTACYRDIPDDDWYGLTWPASPPCQYFVNNGSDQLGIGGPGAFHTADEALRALAANPWTFTFHHDSGSIGVHCYDAIYGDNGGAAVTWKLIRLPDLPTVSISTVTDPGTLTQPGGYSVDDAFSITRSTDDYSSSLSVQLNPWLGTAIQGDPKDYTLEYELIGQDGQPMSSPQPLSGTELDFAPNATSAVVMVQMKESASFKPPATIFGLLKPDSDYLLGSAVAGPATLDRTDLNTLTVADDGSVFSTNNTTVKSTDAGTLYVPETSAGYAVIDATVDSTPDTSDAESSILWDVDGNNALPADGNFGHGGDSDDIFLTPTDGDYSYTLTAGVDKNGNGTLDPDEVTRTVDVHVFAISLKSVDYDGPHAINLTIDGSTPVNSPQWVAGSADQPDTATYAAGEALPVAMAAGDPLQADVIFTLTGDYNGLTSITVGAISNSGYGDFHPTKLSLSGNTATGKVDSAGSDSGVDVQDIAADWQLDSFVVGRSSESEKLDITTTTNRVYTLLSKPVGAMSTPWPKRRYIFRRAMPPPRLLTSGFISSSFSTARCMIPLLANFRHTSVQMWEMHSIHIWLMFFRAKVATQVVRSTCRGFIDTFGDSNSTLFLGGILAEFVIVGSRRSNENVYDYACHVKFRPWVRPQQY